MKTTFAFICAEINTHHMVAFNDLNIVLIMKPRISLLFLHINTNVGEDNPFNQ